MKKLLTAIAMTLVLTLALTACSQGPSVADYATAINEQLATQDLGEGLTAEASAEGNVLVYTYVYSGIAEGTDLELAGQDIAANLDASVTVASFEAIKLECSAVTGVTYRYYTDTNELILDWKMPTK